MSCAQKLASAPAQLTQMNQIDIIKPYGFFLNKTVRIFLETVLLNELGVDITNDTKFYALVANVQSLMEENASIKADLDKLVWQLLDPTMKY